MRNDIVKKNSPNYSINKMNCDYITWPNLDSRNRHDSTILNKNPTYKSRIISMGYQEKLKNKPIRDPIIEKSIYTNSHIIISEEQTPSRQHETNRDKWRTRLRREYLSWLVVGFSSSGRSVKTVLPERVWSERMRGGMHRRLNRWKRLSQACWLATKAEVDVGYPMRPDIQWSYYCWNRIRCSITRV